jgi:hypothetical protein
MLPPHYFEEKFILPASNFTIQTSDDVVAKTEEMNNHLDVVEKNLTKHLGDNYEQFYKAFEKFAAIKTDLKSIKETINVQK